MEYQKFMINTEMLNSAQKEAVLSDDKYLRIIAGAGSGKTRVLTMRIAHLIEDEGVRPYRILAITFTNKAANEMKERVLKMLDDEGYTPWISTIHSLCVRILREDIGVIGYPKNFTIMDGDDQKALVKEALKYYDYDTSKQMTNECVNYISSSKTADISVEQAMILAGSYRDDVEKAKVYEFYMRRQKEISALDFDDLIITTVRMFAKYSDVKEKWQKKFAHILVDEFQDIDPWQYRLIRQLAGKTSSVLVVGDPDQTIYTWRGADVNIIMNFEKDFPYAHTVILNENYRSTMPILSAANSVIMNNRNRLEKELFTSRKSDELVEHFSAADEEAQTVFVADKIAELHRKGKPYKDIAILYRSNYLSRSLEKGLVDYRIPYIIYGGIRFYERQEVKDLLSYLRMVTTADDLALTRILNRPRRGIGPKSIDMIAEQARNTNRTMYEVIRDDALFKGKTATSLTAFVTMIEGWRKKVESGAIDIEDLPETIIDESGYRAMLKEDREKGDERLENLKALVGEIREYAENNPESNLDEYLQMVSLYGDREETTSGDYIQLMTVHAAKGLEFDTVFVTDLNEGIFPNDRAMNEGNRGVEEERRLAYVAFTRARNKLYLTEAGGFSFVLQRAKTTSRFIEEIDNSCLKDLTPKRKEKEVTQEFFKPSAALSTMKTTGTKKKPVVFKKGDLVCHDKFGDGVVISCKDGFAEIAFAYPHGVKKLAAGHPALKKKG